MRSRVGLRQLAPISLTPATIPARCAAPSSPSLRLGGLATRNGSAANTWRNTCAWRPASRCIQGSLRKPRSPLATSRVGLDRRRRRSPPKMGRSKRTCSTDRPRRRPSHHVGRLRGGRPWL